MNTKRENTTLLKQKALAYGFDEVGISKADALDDDARFLKEWLNQGRHGEMGYMENHLDLRSDPRKLVPGAKSVISLTYNYFPKQQQNTDAPKIAKYAYGKDYHKVIRKKLKKLVQELQAALGHFNARVFTDSAPILEHAWAKKSGLGWIGKNSLLLTKGKGSYFFLAEIICDVAFEYDSPVKDYCGSCTKCIDACPTDAIYEPYKVDGSKCISYATIELKDQIPETFKGKMNDWMYGCDICQEVCPINARATPHTEPKFEAKELLLNKSREEWEELTLEEFDEIFEGSAVRRTKYEGLIRNIEFLKKTPLMKEFIQEIITRFGGRYAGTDAETKAQLFVKNKLDAFCDSASITPFYSALRSHFQSLKWFVLVHILSIVLLFFYPSVAFGVSLLNGLLFLCHFVTYRHCLDFLFPKEKSHNVEGVIEPTGEVKNTLIFAGHIDSVKEFKWWYKLKLTGIILTVISSFLLALSFLFIGLIVFVGGTFGTILLVLLLILTPSMWVLFDMHGKEVVHGANDNLTGVALSVSLGKYFAANRLKHTRVRVVSFGAEEMGLRGAFAYAKTHKKRLIEEKALLVNLDTIKDKNFMTIATNETNTLSFFDKTLIQEMKAAFDACDVPVKTLPLAVGASDASAFIIHKLPALSLIAMTTESLDETYHTRLDNMEHLDDEAMKIMKKVMVRFAEQRDQ